MNRIKKCVVWDLDNTLWDGVCLEGNVTVRKDVLTTIEELDRRGILHSIASRGDEELALRVLKTSAVDRFFLVPQINWLPKSHNIVTIAKELQLSLDAIAFVDDDAFEREQVSYMLPDVLTIESEKATDLRDLPEFSPDGITREAQQRRKSYQAEMDRKKAELNYHTREEFLLSCAITLTVRQMNEKDIPRVLELMTRTHQLNTTGVILGHDEVWKIFHNSASGSMIMVAELNDKFGWYGIVGVSIIEMREPVWRLKYLAISCRVMGRGIERAFLVSMVNSAEHKGFSRIEAEFRDTGKNRIMRALYQMIGFTEAQNSAISPTMLFTALPGNISQLPPWVEVR